MSKAKKISERAEIADITPIFKKQNPLDKIRPINILPIVSKIFERMLFN